MAKLKAIEICRNLSSTIKSLEKTAPTVLYQLEEWKPPRATVDELRRVFTRISGKYKLTNRDIDIRKQGE